MKQIQLTRGKFATVDDDMFDRLNMFSWQARLSNNVVWYASRTIREGDKPQWDLYMHNVIMQPKESEWVDHIDRNGLNSVRSNMRITTLRGNMLNRRRWGNSGYRGVYLENGRWRAMIRVNNVLLHLGTYDTPREAAQAYDLAATKHNKELAQLNFPSESTRFGG